MKRGERKAKHKEDREGGREERRGSAEPCHYSGWPPELSQRTESDKKCQSRCLPLRVSSASARSLVTVVEVIVRVQESGVSLICPQV